MNDMQTKNNENAVPTPRLSEWFIEKIAAAIKSSNELGRSKALAKETFEKIYIDSNLELSDAERTALLNEVIEELFGYGPIQHLLDEPEIKEIMINRFDQVYVEKNGELFKTDVAFPNDQAVINLIEKIVEPLGRRIDALNPSVDVRLPDGSRVNAAIPPMTIDGPCLTIRKFGTEGMKMEDYLQSESLSTEMAEFLQACVISRLNILISSGTGSGNKTFLNILSGYIPGSERIVTIEDSAELQLRQEHVVRMEANPAGPDGHGEVSIRHLVQNALRMRPDRIIVGEVRGGEALDILQAMNTGHDGSLITIHANSPQDALSRLETFVLFAGYALPLDAVREQITSAFDLIVQQNRLRDGSRKITSISEIIGLEGEMITINELFTFDETGISDDGHILGEFTPSGTRPMFEPRLKTAGFNLPAKIFGAK